MAQKTVRIGIIASGATDGLFDLIVVPESNTSDHKDLGGLTIDDVTAFAADLLPQYDRATAFQKLRVAAAEVYVADWDRFVEAHKH